MIRLAASIVLSAALSSTALAAAPVGSKLEASFDASISSADQLA